jgi:hypothetical protein
MQGKTLMHTHTHTHRALDITRFLNSPRYTLRTHSSRQIRHQTKRLGKTCPQSFTYSTLHTIVVAGLIDLVDFVN